MRRSLTILALFLFLVPPLHAGVIVTLIPDSNFVTQAPNGVFIANSPYATFQVEVMARLEHPTEAPTPGAPGARLRLAQFDLGASSPNFEITPVTTHTGLAMGGDVTFWDFASTSNCLNGPDSCGDSYFVDGSIVADDILNITYLGLNTNNARQLRLTTADVRIGVLEITLLPVIGLFELDVLNPAATGDAGAKFVYGFGTATDPTVTYTPADGTVTGGRAVFAIPEPATLALLAIGSLIAFSRAKGAS